MSPTAKLPRAHQAELVDYVAEHLLSRAAILVRLLVKQVRSSEISRTELEVLSILREGARRVTELSELEGTSQPTMTLLVRRLEEKGWVRRSRPSDDRRVVMISLTAAGRAAQRRFRAAFLEAMRDDLRELSSDDLRAVAAATETLSSFVDSLNSRPRR